MGEATAVILAKAKIERLLSWQESLRIEDVLLHDLQC